MPKHKEKSNELFGSEAWGGPSQTHRYLSDANTDWGQQLKAAKLYLDRRGIKNCWIAYFPDGAIDPADYGIPCRPLPTIVSLWWMQRSMQVPAAIDGPVLISDGILEGMDFGQGPLNPYDSFLHLRPTASLQYGLYVYEGHFDIPLASALTHAQTAEHLVHSNQLGAAQQEADQALALAPRSVMVRMVMGDVLAHENRRPEALANLRTALALATTVEPSLQSYFVPPLQQAIQKLAAK